MAERQIVIENREELTFLLSETPWHQHMVMLAYLFAAFSFKPEVGTPTCSALEHKYQILYQQAPSGGDSITCILRHLR